MPDWISQTLWIWRGENDRARDKYKWRQTSFWDLELGKGSQMAPPLWSLGALWGSGFHSSSWSRAVSSPARGLESSRLAGWREAVKDEDRHDRQPCRVVRRKRNLAYSYSSPWIVKFNCCRWPGSSCMEIQFDYTWRQMALEHRLLWTLELPSLACHFRCLWKLSGEDVLVGAREEQRTCLVLDVQGTGWERSL